MNYINLLIIGLILILPLSLSGCLGEIDSILEEDEGNNDIKEYYTIITNVQSGEGTINLTPEQSEYEAGTEVTIEAVPDTNFLFGHWSGSISSSQREQLIIVDDNLTISASFVEAISSINAVTKITSDNLAASEFPVNLTGTINDPNGDISEVIINWGDGTSNTVTSGYNSIDIDHTYSTEQEYTITITGINSNGENITDTVNIDLTIINFADETLKQVVQDELNKDPEAEITAYDAQKVTDLHAGQDILGATISSLSGIEHLNNLTDLTLYGHNLSDISYLSDLTNLEDLSLSDNDITDLSPLANLTNLTVLTLKRNNISDITTIANFTDLENLKLSYNNITDLSPLSGLNNLNYLYLRNNGLSDLDPLSNLTNLTNLYLDDNSISDIGSLYDLTGLSTLTLENNSLDLTSGSDDMSVITHLEDNGVNVSY